MPANVQAPPQTGTVRCDECDQSFRPKLERRELENGGEHVWFACPRCGKEYTVAWTSRRGRAIRKRLVAIRAEFTALRLAPATGDVVARWQDLAEEFTGLRRELEYEVAT